MPGFLVQNNRLLHERRLRTLGLRMSQGCGLRKITESPKAANQEIWGAQHLLSFMKKVGFSSRPKTKVNRLWHPGAARVKP